MDDQVSPESTGGKQQHFYIFCDVGVGRPYIVDSDAPRTKPEGYDSLYLSKKTMDDDGDGVISAEEYEAIVGNEGKVRTGPRSERTDRRRDGAKRHLVL